MMKIFLILLSFSFILIGNGLGATIFLDDPYFPKYNEEAIEKLDNRIQELQPKIDPAISHLIAKTINKYSNKYEVWDSLVLHIMFRESSFNLFARSRIGCIGLMQINYKVHKNDLPELEKVTEYELYHIDKNIEVGCAILSKYMENSDTIEQTLYRYFGGERKFYVDSIFNLMSEYKGE